MKIIVALMTNLAWRLIIVGNAWIQFYDKTY